MDFERDRDALANRQDSCEGLAKRKNRAAHVVVAPWACQEWYLKSLQESWNQRMSKATGRGPWNWTMQKAKRGREIQRQEIWNRSFESDPHDLASRNEARWSPKRAAILGWSVQWEAMRMAKRWARVRGRARWPGRCWRDERGRDRRGPTWWIANAARLALPKSCGRERRCVGRFLLESGVQCHWVDSGQRCEHWIAALPMGGLLREKHCRCCCWSLSSNLRSLYEPKDAGSESWRR